MLKVCIVQKLHFVVIVNLLSMWKNCNFFGILSHIKLYLQQATLSVEFHIFSSPFHFIQFLWYY